MDMGRREPVKSEHARAALGQLIERGAAGGAETENNDIVAFQEPVPAA
jgi:hypothetical protein